MSNKKFRVWDTEEGWYSTFIDSIQQDGALLYHWGCDNHKSVIMSLYNDSYIVEFTIGKLDKKEKEIYDGDILLVEDYEYDERTGNYINFIGVVYYDKANLCWSIKNNEDYFPLYDIRDYKTEIIGNIHKHKYLLEQTNNK